MIRRFKYIIIQFALLVIAAGMFSACSPSPIDTIYDAYASIEYIMRTNIDDPHKLVEELNAFSAANRAKLNDARVACDKMGKEQKVRMIDQRLDDLNDITQKLVNLDLEIQDRLAQTPADLELYRQSVQNLGVVQPQNK